jgi:tRNA (cmo5U34)-methyltransferase
MDPHVFDKAAQQYDRARYQLVPCLPELYGAAVRQLPFTRGADFHVLDLGAGIGLLSAYVAEAFPHARFTLIDFAPAMLERARLRFGGGVRFRYVVQDYARDPLPETYDAVISALSIHHLNAYEKRNLFARILRALPIDGVFVNADQVLGPTPEVERRYQEEWIEQARERDVSIADLEASLERQKSDQCSTLEEQLTWLRDAGFRNVDVPYKNQRFAVMAGQR